MSIIRSNYCPQILPCVLLILTFVSVAISQKSTPIFESKKNDLLKVKLEVIEKRYCNSQTTVFSAINSKKGARYSEKVGELHLKLRILLTNNSPEPVILDKTSMQIAKRTITKQSSDENSGHIISNVFYYITPSSNKLDVLSPKEPLFATLQPNSTYINEIDDLVLFSKDNSEEIMKGVSIKYEILSWSGQRRIGEQLKENWKKFGVLWLDPLISDSIAIKIDQNASDIACSQ